MSFFDEDDEPRTRVRPRRPATAGAVRPSPTARPVLIRRAVLVRRLHRSSSSSCLHRRRLPATRRRRTRCKDYNRDVGRARPRLRQRGRQAVLRPAAQPRARRRPVAPRSPSFKAQADTQYQQAQADQHARRPDRRAALVPDHDGDAARRAAVDRRPDRAPRSAPTPRPPTQAISEIAGAMQMFLASDVIYTTRVAPLIEDALEEPRSAASGSSAPSSCPGWQWLDPTRSPTRSASSCRPAAAAAGGREPAPGLHGTGIDSVAGRRPHARRRAPRTGSPTGRTPSSPSTSPTRARTTSSTSRSSLRIEGGPEPIRVTDRPSPSRRRRARPPTATLALDTPPPFDTPVTISVEVKPVPGEEKTRQQQRRVRRAVLAAVAVA